ncbi:MAG: exodeoxyribonuclease III [Pelagibacterium sp.]|jgi:exodeoxyribonuclease-3|uniref:exodeoxyribonuclease III n=1 Tax=Pelagibacterium sp. TaxID=1967288 RepID=UPI0032ED794A|tara:strand:- start:4663 stop:5469 length:807 start_codon:yes stop_codon:yes gene_type:complete
MRIATWNINGINARLPAILTWLDETKPDIVGLQEIKCLDENFPRAEFESRGYNVETHGQKSFNGVALLSKLPFDEVHRGLPGNDEDPQSRLIEGVFSTEDGGVVRVCNIYLPNGNPVDSEKFPYKLGWMDRLHDFVEQRLAHEEPFVLMGDFNLIPTGFDCHDPSVWWGDALFRPESLEKWRRLVNLGLTDALRATTGDQAFTFWDFQAGAWRRNAGIRIDHLLLSPQAADRLKGVTIHKDTRGWDKPSDHVPVEGDFALAGLSAKAA